MKNMDHIRNKMGAKMSEFEKWWDSIAEIPPCGWNGYESIYARMAWNAAVEASAKIAENCRPAVSRDLLPEPSEVRATRISVENGLTAIIAEKIRGLTEK